MPHHEVRPCLASPRACPPCRQRTAVTPPPHWWAAGKRAHRRLSRSLDDAAVSNATTLNATSSTDAISAVPKLTRTRYAPAPRAAASAGSARRSQERARSAARKLLGSTYSTSPCCDTWRAQALAVSAGCALAVPAHAAKQRATALRECGPAAHTCTPPHVCSGKAWQ